MSDSDKTEDAIGTFLDGSDKAVAALDQAIETHRAYLKSRHTGITIESYNPAAGTPEERRYLSHLSLLADILRKQHNLIIMLDDQLNKLR